MPRSLSRHAENPYDIPFAAIYLLDDHATHARLAAGARLPAGATAFPEHHPLVSDEAGSWPLARSVTTRAAVEVVDVADSIGVFPCEPWPDPIETTIILPLLASGQTKPAGILIAGISPCRVLDADYRGFYDRIAGHLARSIADARAYEKEHRRAEALTEIDRAKTAFLSNVSQEFRTPLTLTISPIEQVLASPEAEVFPMGRDLLRIAYRNCLRLLRLVNTMLDFSRIEAGRMEASYEPTDLAGLTADLVSNFRSACERAGLELHMHCSPLHQQVHVDREMWEKVVLNLMSNAFKFPLDGRIEVTIGAGSKNAWLVVADTGVGISETELPRVFERFQRSRGRRGRTDEGTGIGLAMVQELVRLHGGEIRVQSEVGRGTTVTVTIPLGRAHLPDECVHARPSSATTTAIGAEAFAEEALRWLPAGGDAVLRLDTRARGTAAESQRARVLIADDNSDMPTSFSCSLLPGRSRRWLTDRQLSCPAAKARSDPD